LFGEKFAAEHLEFGSPRYALERQTTELCQCPWAIAQREESLDASCRRLCRERAIGKRARVVVEGAERAASIVLAMELGKRSLDRLGLSSELAWLRLFGPRFP
jgi:hypothetical protein